MLLGTRRGLGTPVFKTFPCLIPLGGGSAPALLGRRALVQLRLFVISGKCQHQELVIIGIYTSNYLYFIGFCHILYWYIIFYFILFFYFFYFIIIFFFSQYC